MYSKIRFKVELICWPSRRCRETGSSSPRSYRCGRIRCWSTCRDIYSQVCLIDQIVSFTFRKSDGALTSEFFFKLHVANHILKCFEMYPNQICHRQPYCQILNVFKLSKSSNLSSPTIFWSQHSSSPACKELSNNKLSKSFQMFQMYKFNKKSMFFCKCVSRYVQKFLIIVKCWQKIKMLRIISNLSKH